jgi:hypothetical protein
MFHLANLDHSEREKERKKERKKEWRLVLQATG